MDNRVATLEARAQRGAIAGVRILAGALWLANVHWKVPPAFGEDTQGGLYKYTASVSRHSTFAPFTWVVEEIILPNFRLFGWFTLLAELVLAMTLLFGYRTKVFSLLGAGFAVPIMLSVLYYDRADEWSWSYLMMIGLHLLLCAVDAGRFVGLDGVRDREPALRRRALQSLGVVAGVLGLLGLFVSRSVDFAGRQAALLGSDAGFVNDDGSVTRRWELKFLWFNPLWAVLTVILGVLLVLGAKRLPVAAWVATAGFAAMGLVVLATKTFDYVRDDGSIQVVSTASNAAVWGGFALSGAVLLGRVHPRFRPRSDGTAAVVE